MKKRLAVFCATFGYIGYMPWAPGTWGSLAAACVALGLIDSQAALWGVFLLCLGAGLWSCRYAQACFGASDPGPIVIDEVCGMLIVFLFVPVTPLSLVLGFVGFRLVDIFKPLGIRWLERLRAPWGIMLDDVAGGFLVGIILWLAHQKGLL